MSEVVVDPPVESRFRKMLARWVGKDLVNYVVPVFLISAMGVCVTILTIVSQSNQLDASIQADRGDRAVEDCRAQYTSAISDAQTDYLVSFGEALTAYAEGRPTAPLLDEVEAYAEVLQEATHVRAEFELNPTGECTAEFAE